MKAIANNSISTASDREVDFLNILIEVADIVSPEDVNSLIEAITASSNTATVVSDDGALKKTLRAVILDFKSRTGATVPTELSIYENFSFLGMLALIMALAKWPELATGTGYKIRVTEYSDTFKSLNEYGLPTSAIPLINNRMHFDARAFMRITANWLNTEAAERFCMLSFPNVFKPKSSAITRFLAYTPLANKGSASYNILMLPLTLASALAYQLVLLSFIAPFKSLAMQSYLRNTLVAVTEPADTRFQIMASGMEYCSLLSTLKMHASDLILVYGHIIKLYIFTVRTYATIIFSIPSMLMRTMAFIMNLAEAPDSFAEFLESMIATGFMPPFLADWIVAVTPVIETFIVSYIAGRTVAADGTLFSWDKAAAIKAAYSKDFYNILAALFANTSYEEFVMSIVDAEAFEEAKYLLEFSKAFARLDPTQITFVNDSELLDARNYPAIAASLNLNMVDLKNQSKGPEGAAGEEL
jgi:hypothetical protein